MCSVIVLRQPGSPWPLLIAGNRDEMADRPWLGPARHWPDRPNVIAGLDRLGGGTWLGINDEGVMATVLNRVGTLGPAPGRRSRGELVLEALDHADAADAAAALADLDGRAWRPFNLVIADDRDAFVLCHRGDGPGDRGPGDRPGRITVARVPIGLTMITAFDPDDPADPRIRHYRPQFAASAPDLERGDWTGWERLLASRDTEPGAAATGAMCFLLPSGFGTVCSALIGLADSATRRDGPRAVWRFAAGPPDTAPWLPIPLARDEGAPAGAQPVA